jgi:ribosomal protein S18 acetylase RimI-like enzyme
MQPETSGADSITLRTEMRPGDLGMIVYLHGALYAPERGYGPAFEAYVAAPLADFVRNPSPRQRLWIAERGGQIVGSIAIVAATAKTAQLRWLLVDPTARGIGLGRRLLDEAIRFSRECAYANIILWTESALTAAARLYRAAGFRNVESKPGCLGGVAVVEEKYELTLD